MHIRQLTIVTVLASVAAAPLSTVLAADLTQYTAPMPAASYADAGLAVATDDWTGFYAGVNAGGITSNDFSEGNTSWTAGAQAGYLQQFGMFVVGAEVQGAWTNELNYVLTPGAGLQQNWSVAAKARAGVALGQTLIYGTAGASMAELAPTGTTTSAADTHLGAVFGGGVEQALGNNISVQAEYLQTRYFDVNSAVGGAGRIDELTNHAITLGVNYRF